MRLRCGRWGWRRWARCELLPRPACAALLPRPALRGGETSRARSERVGGRALCPRILASRMRRLPSPGSQERSDLSPRRAGRGEESSPPRPLPPRREIRQRLLIRRGIKPKNRPAFSHLLSDKILELCHLEAFIGDLVDAL